MSRHWKTPDDVRRAVERRWNDGSLLRSYALGNGFPAITVPLGGPTASELGAQWHEWKTWAAALHRASHDGAHFDLEERALGGRGAVGRNMVPHRAVISSHDQAWRLLGRAAEAETFSLLVRNTDETKPRSWAVDHPLKALELSGSWDKLVQAYRWLEDSRGTGRYLRQIDVRGVDTKFVETHRGPLGAMLEVPQARTAFEEALGLQVKPRYLRLRLDPSVSPIPGTTELTMRVGDLPRLGVSPRSVLMVENEITFLTVPVPAGGVVLWGRGFDGRRREVLEHFHAAEFYYWGDLDTHGFAILNGVRAHLPQVRSVLMDRETLLAHQDQWGVEPKPTHASLPSLTPSEHALYEDLVTDRYTETLRLEQERINWAWVLSRLPE